MIARVGAFAAIVSGVSAEHDLFEQYMTKFSKEYSPEEAAVRKEVFLRNVGHITAVNREKGSWFGGLNDFSDWTLEEFVANRASGTRPHHAAGLLSARARSNLTLADLPEAHEWRDVDGVVTDPKDQGSCGSCWAFSAVEALESHLAIATGDAALILSPQQVVSCSPNPDSCGGTGGCQGSTQPLAFEYTKGTGIALESDYAYKPFTSGACKDSEVSMAAQNGGYTILTSNDYTEMITAVYEVGPMSVGVAAGGIGWQLYGGGIFSGGATGCGYVVDHAVIVTGYGTDGGKMYWSVRNSWGARWGESGYMRLERFGEGQEPCGMDNKPGDGFACAGDTTPIEYCGLCGILSYTSYPTDMSYVSQVVV